MSSLPEHLVAVPRPRGLGRLAVGTAPFTVAAALTLTAMSAFVVMSPMTTRATRAVEHASAAPRAERTESYTRRSADAIDRSAHRATVTTTSHPSPTTTAAPRHESTTTTPDTSASGSDAQLASTPISLRTARCTDFSLQPEAQAAFDADPIGRAGLDGDGDGVACEQLPGRQVVTPVLQRRMPTMTQVLHPDTRLFGVHTPQAPFANSEMDDFSSAAGKTPNTVLFFQNFSEGFPSDAINAAWTRGMLPMITFEPIIQNSTQGQPTLADISSGGWDTYFTAWATAAKADGRPIAFRFGQEMNGNWYSWSDGRFGNAPGEFVTAWRHIHDLFDTVGVSNVVWVWSINRVDNLPDKTLARVYPGDDYVDWVGISGYLRSVPDGVAPTFDDTFGRTLAAVRTLAPDKLVMLTEVGAGTTEANRVDWMASFFQGLLDHPEIIGFNWFDAFKDGGDWRIQYSQATSAAFAEGVADSRYGVLAPTIPAS